MVKVAGLPSFDAGTIVFQDYVGARTKTILQSWLSLAYDVKNDQVGYMKDYKKDCYLLEYDVGFKLLRSWLLKGCWVSQLSEGDFDKSNNDLRQINATLQYDRAIPEQNDSL